jgi:hypothetical protein
MAMSKFRSALVASVIGVCGAGVAHAWEPVPLDAALQTTVTRVVDVAQTPWGPAVALAESPAAACGVLRATPGARPLYGDAWVVLSANNPSAALAVALAAKAQNLQVRVAVWNQNTQCMVYDLRTCTDAAACALPPAP